MRKVFSFVISSVLLSASVASANEYTEGKMVSKEISLTDMYYLAPKDEVINNSAAENKTKVINTTSNRSNIQISEFEKNSNKESDETYSIEGFQVGGGIGVLDGVNASVGYRVPRQDGNFWKNRFGFRLDYNTWRPLKKSIDRYFEDHPVKIDDEPIETTIKGHSFGALVDFYPFGNTFGLGNFRLSGGYYTGDFELAGLLHRYGIATEDVMFSVRNKMYTINAGNSADVYLNAKLEADIKGPYAGFGFDIALFSGLKFFFDTGVVFLDNKPEISTDVWGRGTVNVSSVNGMTVVNEGTIDLSNLDATSRKKLDQMKSNFRAEYEDELEEITKKYFPMVKFGFLYRF